VFCAASLHKTHNRPYYIVMRLGEKTTQVICRINF
jgi:hypothetical protein